MLKPSELYAFWLRGALDKARTAVTKDDVMLTQLNPNGDYAKSVRRMAALRREVLAVYERAMAQEATE